MSKQIKSRNWLITRNIKDGELLDWQSWLKGLYTKTKAVYVVGQLEMGLHEQRLHIQAYANYANGKVLGGMKKYCKEMHLEVCKNASASEKYCMKVDTRVEGPIEHGVKPVQRNSKDDWDEVLQKAREGRFEEIPSSILVQNYGNISKLYKDNLKVQDSDHLRGIFIWGKSGIGKSTLARELFIDKYTTYTKQHNKWWDSYKGEEVVIWDDITPEEGKVSGTHLKLYTDRFGIVGETKGSGVPLTYRYFIMTSQYSMEEVFEDQKTLEAMKRRCYSYEMYTDETFGNSLFNFDHMRQKLWGGEKIDPASFMTGEKTDL